MRLAAGLLALLLCGCATNLPVAELAVEKKLDENPTRKATFEYLGAGGWLIRRGNDAVLTAPFFSNPALLRLAFSIGPNKDVIAKEMGSLMLDDVRVVLAGHGHYDHLMDLPEVVKLLPRDAMVLGGETVCNSLGRGLWRPCIPVTSHAGTRYHRPKPFRVGENIVIRPIFSEHAAHSWGVKFLNGHFSEMADAVPAKPRLWREGETLAYLIDFMNGNEIDLRVYYIDSAPGSPYGLPDDVTLERKVDVAILCVASYAQQSDYPKAYLDLMKPGHVLLGHWENFFRSAAKSIRPVPRTNVAEFMKRVVDYPHTLPNRHTVVTVAY